MPTPQGQKIKNVAIIDNCPFFRKGIEHLLKEINPNIRIKSAVSDYSVAEIAMTFMDIDLIVFSVPNSNYINYHVVSFIRRIKENYPSIKLCVYTNAINKMILFQCDIDMFLSKHDPLSFSKKWLRDFLSDKNEFHKLALQHRHPDVLLTTDEWFILEKIKQGKSLNEVAKKKRVTYRQVSALKNSATRKLGLKHKNELLLFLMYE